MTEQSSGRIVSVNVSPGGIPKRPVPETGIRFRGLNGDSWAHPRFHGGPRQAVLLIAQEAIEQLKALGFPLFPGALGENLTTEGLAFREWRAGRRFRAGTAVIELTKVRTPCNTLSVYGTGVQSAMYDAAVKAGDTSSPRWAMSGFYAQVIEEGLVRTGDRIERIEP